MAKKKKRKEKKKRRKRKEKITGMELGFLYTTYGTMGVWKSIDVCTIVWVCIVLV